METSLPTFQQLWFDALGTQYLPTVKPAHAVCVCCGANGDCYPRAAEVFCGPCWTLSAKKPMQSKDTVAGPNGSHVVIASRSKFRYLGDLRPMAALAPGVSVEPARYPELVMAEFVLSPPTEPTYFVQLDRAYREIVRSCRLTISARAVHLNGPSPRCVDATALRDVLHCMSGEWPDGRDVVALSGARVQLGKGPLAGKAYHEARAALEAWHQRYPGLRDLWPVKGAWTVEPQTDDWAVLQICLRHLRQGDLSL